MAIRKKWDRFGIGAAVGAGAGAAALLGWKLLQNRAGILRLEESVQIGKPVEEVFNAWSSLERLPQFVRALEEVRREDGRSHWRARIDGRTVSWDAELIQYIPNQALGWESVSGPKHTGRITFSPLGDNTLVHVVMNYYPRLGPLGRLLRPASGALERQIDQALRDFKAALEGKGQESRIEERGTGTLGRAGSEMQTSRFGGETGAGWTRPTEPKYP